MMAYNRAALLLVALLATAFVVGSTAAEVTSGTQQAAYKANKVDKAAAIAARKNSPVLTFYAANPQEERAINALLANTEPKPLSVDPKKPLKNGTLVKATFADAAAKQQFWANVKAKEATDNDAKTVGEAIKARKAKHTERKAKHAGKNAEKKATIQKSGLDIPVTKPPTSP